MFTTLKGPHVIYLTRNDSQIIHSVTYKYNSHLKSNKMCAFTRVEASSSRSKKYNAFRAKCNTTN